MSHPTPLPYHGTKVACISHPVVVLFPLFRIKTHLNIEAGEKAEHPIGADVANKRHAQRDEAVLTTHHHKQRLPAVLKRRCHTEVM